MAESKNIWPNDYSLKIGLLKTLKNTAIMFGLPALVYILNEAHTFVPEGYMPFVALLLGALSYFTKNKVENTPKQ